jgi:hypothetical protein
MRRNDKILSSHFPPHSHPTSFKIVDNQWFVKTRAGFGYFPRHPSAGVILINHSLSTSYQNSDWLWGRKIRPRKIQTGIINWAGISRWAGMTQVPGKCPGFVAKWFTFPVAFRQLPCVGPYVSFL